MKEEYHEIMPMEEYERMTAQEQASLLAHSLVDLSQRIYKAKSSKGLEVLMMNLESITDYVRELYRDLRKTEMTEDITSQLSDLSEMLKDSDGISEDFICGLEDLLKYAQVCLEENERNEDTELAEKSALENMKILLWRSEQLAAKIAE